MADRLYTLAEARASLPVVRDLVVGIQEHKRALEQLRGLTEAIRRAATGDGQAVHSDARAIEARAEETVQVLRSHVAQLTGMGVQLKDADRGLVDWVAEHGGRRVLLCWQAGEQTIAWWHEIADGVAGRRRILPEEWT